MSKLFLDSNIWLRFFVRDNPQYESVEKLISAIESGGYLPYTSAIVLLEVSYVLKTAYRQPKDKIIQYIQSIWDLRNITIVEKTNSKEALKILKRTGIKYSDCLIASQLTAGMLLVTFDKEFSKIKGLTIKTPAQIVSEK